MIQLNNIQFAYVPNRKIFEEVNVEMSLGHIYGLLGKNGAGKTTLLKIMSGLRFPNAGTVTLFGQNMCKRGLESLQDLYFLQEEMFVPHLTIAQFVKSYAPFYPAFSIDQFYSYLNEFELVKENGYMDQLSQGQKKKVLITFALATNTRVLIMDEPTNGLDIPSKSTFRKLMASVADEHRLVVISTHQVRDLHSLIDMVAILDNGRMVINNSTYEITEKLLFDVDSMKSSNGQIFYEEETPRGTYQVKENVDHVESNLDLELLFNATLMNKQAISNLFK